MSLMLVTGGGSSLASEVNRSGVKSAKANSQSVKLYLIQDIFDTSAFIDQQGNQVIEPIFSDGRPFRHGLAAVRAQDKQGNLRWGFINESGKFVIEPKYTSVTGDGFSDSGKAIVGMTPYQDVIIDRSGKETPIPAGLSTQTSFSNGLAIVYNSDFELGLINESGRLVVEPKFAQIQTGDSLTLVRLNSRTSSNYIDSNGKFLFDSQALDPVPTYTSATTFSEDRAIVKLAQGEKYSLIDSDGQIIKDFKLSDVLSGFIDLQCGTVKGYSQGLIGARFFPTGVNPNSRRSVRKYKCGYLDRDGLVAVEPAFDYAMPFSEGLAAVKIGNKWGYINLKGEMVIEPEYATAGKFDNGLAVVSRYSDNMRFGYINTKGELVYKSR